MPEKYESGTLNAVGIAGLGAGLKFLRRVGKEKIHQHEMGLTNRFIKGAESIGGLRIYGPLKDEERVLWFPLAWRAIRQGRSVIGWIRSLILDVGRVALCAGCASYLGDF
ncbi:hypothetical protein N752_10415 [Desulforamulus aquiferis]|nr:hypothetical protein N752_10415 [Desulforamulus aquiferis]